MRSRSLCRSDAAPEMEVSGVRRSWPMERRRLARVCSFLAIRAVSSRSRMACVARLACSWRRLASVDASRAVTSITTKVGP